MARRAVSIVISGATELVFTEVQAAVTRIYKALISIVGGAVETAIKSVI